TSGCDLAAAGAVRDLPVLEPPQPGFRQHDRAAAGVLPAAVDHARVRGDVELLQSRARLRVVHRRPRVPGRSRVVRGERAPPPALAGTPTEAQSGLVLRCSGATSTSPPSIPAP